MLFSIYLILFQVTYLALAGSLLIALKLHKTDIEAKNGERIIKTRKGRNVIKSRSINTSLPVSSVPSVTVRQ
jgi:hypothetical protein